jgi:hypothetical protein
MYLNALEFLEEEREAWRPYEALAALSDAALDRPVEGAHGWTGRDLIGHLVAWQEWALATAKELAVGSASPTKVRLDAEWAARGDGMNADIQAEWRALPMEDVRRRFGEVAGELRAYLTVLPETRWLNNDDYRRYFSDETIDHYADHLGDLEAVLAASAG